MEKASTPRNRLTRSSAKQVNPPKHLEQEESVERSPGEEVKHNLRKTRRRCDTKAKTNGDATNTENKMNNEDTVEDNQYDEYEHEDQNLNKKSEGTPKSLPQNTLSPTISRRSLRTRRSLTPGPELELSASKKMKRSSSFGKLESVSTPTNRRGRRATSESKDFVFTPSKDKQSGSHDTNGKYIPNTSLRIIEKIDEVNEGEKSFEDDRENMKQEEKLISSEPEVIATPVKSVGKEEMVEQSESKDVNATSIKETELSSHSMEDINERVVANHSVDNNVSSCDKVPDASESTDSCVQDSQLLIDDTTKAKETEVINPKTEIEDSEPKVEHCSLPTEVETQLSNIINVSEDNIEINLSAKEILSSNDLQKESVDLSAKEILSSNDLQKEGDMVNELVNKSEENEVEENVMKDVIKENMNIETETSVEMSSEIQTPLEKNSEIQISVEKKDRIQTSLEKNSRVQISEENNSEIQTSVETNEIIHNIIIKTSDQCEYKNIEINLVDDEDSETSLKQLNDKLQSIMDEGMEESDNDNSAVEISDSSKISKRHVERIPTTEDEAQHSEISKIDLVINSSDSEDGIIEERSQNSSTNKCKFNDYENECDKSNGAENENIITAENGAVEKESFIKKTESETIEDNFSGIVKEKNDDCNYEEHDKEPETDSYYENIENVSHTKSNTGRKSSDRKVIDVLKNDSGNKTEEMPSLYVMDTEPSKPFNIVIENPHTITGCLTSHGQEIIFQNSPLKDRFSDLDQVEKLQKHSHVQEELNDGSFSRLNERDTEQSDILLDKVSKSNSVDNYDEVNYNEEPFEENYEDEELNKSEEGSCDIYKGLSDSGSYVDDKGEGSQFGESASSELQSGSGDSEEYVTSADEEEEENVEEKTRLINQLCSGPIDQKTKELILSKAGEKAHDNNPDSPMTYDKALAIINKNRVKKIDDEEFFDMFTEELNRVSEQSGSDSDIAIVDEYLMEPEEPAKKVQQKSGNIQNAKQPPRPSGPALVNQPIPSENYPGGYNQPIHAQHGNVINQHNHPIPTQPNHPAMQRVNFTQGAMYQQFDQNMHIRGQLMYNQYGHPSTSIQDPHMFNPSVSHSDVNYSTGMYTPHPLCPESSFPPNNSSLKVRTVNDMNNAQTYKNYTEQAPLNAPSEERTFECQEDKDNFEMSSPAVTESYKVDTCRTKANISETAKSHDFTTKKADKSRTPILDLLGLDEKALKLLKKVLGLNSIKRELMKRDLEWQKKCLEKSILKSELRQQGRKREIRYRNSKRYRESDSSSLKSSSEQSSEGSSITTSCFSKRQNHGSSSDNDIRKVDIGGRSVYVTVQTKNKPRHRNHKEFFSRKKPCLRSSIKNFETAKQERKKKCRRRSSSSAVKLGSKKMTQKQTTLVKSQCGVFTVDPLTASSQSSDSEAQFLDDQDQVQEFRRKIKNDLASGKNKLSNMFAQHSFQEPKESKKKLSKPFEEIKGPFRKENLKQSRKLPTDVLEALAKEDKKKKRHRAIDSGSDEAIERPKKIRKRSQKIKIKSKAADQNYIPCVTGGATEFGLSRLDKDNSLTLAERAANFRTDQLYGASVKRITSKELMNIKKKQSRNNAFAKKKLGKKNVE